MCEWRWNVKISWNAEEPGKTAAMIADQSPSRLRPYTDGMPALAAGLLWIFHHSALLLPGRPKY